MICAIGIFISPAVYAHAPADIFMLGIWYFVFLVALLVYLILSSSNWKTKGFVCGGVFAVTALSLLISSAFSIKINTPASQTVSVALGIAPVLGVYIGIKFAKSNAKKT